MDIRKINPKGFNQETNWFQNDRQCREIEKKVTWNWNLWKFDEVSEILQSERGTLVHSKRLPLEKLCIWAWNFAWVRWKRRGWTWAYKQNHLISTSLWKLYQCMMLWLHRFWNIIYYSFYMWQSYLISGSFSLQNEFFLTDIHGVSPDIIINYLSEYNLWGTGQAVTSSPFSLVFLLKQTVPFLASRFLFVLVYVR